MAKKVGALLLASLLLLVTGCGGAAPGEAPLPTLSGAGATFPQPIYEKWFYLYGLEHPEVRINYQGVGSGGGIRQFIEGTVDFAASDAPMKDAELAKAPPVIQVPTVIGAITLSYNLPELTDPLRLSPANLAAIYLGEITVWNDPRLVADNPALANYDREVAVVYRSDGSGTTANFTEYLASVSDAWATQVGQGKSVRWPTGIGGKGNDGVAGLIKQVPGAIGYLELAAARSLDMQTASLLNRAGQWVQPSVETAAAAAAGVDDLLASLIDTEGEGAYPIASFTYLLLYAEPTDKVKADQIKAFVHWALTEGAAEAEAMNYAPLPPAVRDRALEMLQ